MQAWTHSEGAQDAADRPDTVYAKPLPPQDGNELDTTKREREERQIMQNMLCNIQRRLTTGEGPVGGS